MNKPKTLQAIDREIESRQGSGFRRHLGASVIGRPCSRQLWYIFRWAKQVRHPARLLRLFDRGQREEERFVRWLQTSGIHVVDKDLETGKQLRISDHNDHFGGSLDSVLFDTPEYPRVWVLGEYKTHSDKYFKEVRKKGVKKSKFEHYVQMQLYMHYMKLAAAFYFAINKNDDDLYVEIVEYDRETALKYVDRAGRIIEAETPPERIPNASPGWYVCRFCDFTDVCHNGEPKAMNCRTCTHSKPIDNGQWLCRRYNYTLTENEQKMGCTMHSPILED